MAKKQAQQPEPPKKGGAIRAFVNAADRAAERVASRGGKVMASGERPDGKCFCGKKALPRFSGTCGKPACLKKLAQEF